LAVGLDSEDGAFVPARIANGEIHRPPARVTPEAME
jgi:hypothetical protein